MKHFKEQLIKKTFWNLPVPGCNEHYFAHQPDESGFEEFDSTFEQMEKGYRYTQELFYIYSRSNVLR